MLVRNYAKPFCIAGFILGEIYMLFVVLAPYGKDRGRGLPAPIPMEESVAAGTPVPTGAMAARIIACGMLFGPFGGLVGLGVGLVVSGVAQRFRPSEGGAAGREDGPPKASG
jgi:hypothetical protein